MIGPVRRKTVWISMSNTPGATAEKAFHDWLYLGSSKYSKITGPPLDVEVARLDAARLRYVTERCAAYAPVRSLRMK